MSESLIVRSRLGSHRRAKDHYRKRTGPFHPCAVAYRGEPRAWHIAHRAHYGGRRRSGSAALGCHAYQGCTPTTHDLLLDALTNLDASVDHVLIDKVKGSLFFAKLTLSQHGRLIELDARPSDALSLALREDAPLYINEDVLERASYPYIVRKPIEDESAEEELEEFRSFLEDLDQRTSRSTAATTIPADRHST